jgi:hypothetical protein
MSSFSCRRVPISSKHTFLFISAIFEKAIWYNRDMKRTVYYIIHCSSEENQNGMFHYSKPFISFALAKQASKRIKDDFVVIEKHHEIYDRYEWRPDFDRDSWSEVIEF